MKLADIIKRGTLILFISFISGFIAKCTGFTDFKQIISVSVFMMIISATLLFWNFRLSIAFIGLSVLLGGKVITLDQMVHSAELDIILFLIGMMTLVGVLKDLGLFTWIIQVVINMKKINGTMFIVIIIFLSAIMACIVDEVTSIVFVLTLVFQVCDTLKIKPTPFAMISILSTNIGSSATMLGNPVGILIGTKAGLSFQDFLIHATPISFISLLAALFFMLLWYRPEIKELSKHLDTRREMNLALGPLIKIPYKRGLAILTSAILLIALHHQIEHFLHIQKNTILIIAPLFISGILMIWKNNRARHYIESEVEWWTLLFFMMLFAVAGSLEHSGVTAVIAVKFKGIFGQNTHMLTPFIVFLTAIGSAFVDNIVFVAAFIPVIKELGSQELWWALLFGACFGGNITVIGSTANIVALGMLEKRYKKQIPFKQWLKVGFWIGLLTCTIASFAIVYLN